MWRLEAGGALFYPQKRAPDPWADKTDLIRRGRAHPSGHYCATSDGYRPQYRKLDDLVGRANLRANRMRRLAGWFGQEFTNEAPLNRLLETCWLLRWPTDGS